METMDSRNWWHCSFWYNNCGGSDLSEKSAWP